MTAHPLNGRIVSFYSPKKSGNGFRVGLVRRTRSVRGTLAEVTVQELDHGLVHAKSVGARYRGRLSKVGVENVREVLTHTRRTNLRTWLERRAT